MIATRTKGARPAPPSLRRLVSSFSLPVSTRSDSFSERALMLDKTEEEEKEGHCSIYHLSYPCLSKPYSHCYLRP